MVSLEATLGAAVTWFLPCSFDQYNATSAALIRESMSPAQSGKTETPKLAVICSTAPPYAITSFSIVSLIHSATPTAPTMSVSGKTKANSSPPYLTGKSCVLTAFLNIPATLFKTSSPV